MKIRLLTSTAIYLFIAPEKSLGGMRSSAQGFQKSPASVGMMISEWLYCPEISKAEVRELQIKQHKRITRHINKNYLESAIRGYFRFGTIIEYRPKDQNLIGRFSDIQEGSQNNYYTSRTSLYNYSSRTTTLRDNIVIGFDQGLLIEFFCNDYCSCSSVGDYNKARALELRDKGNPDIGAYIVYDFDKLVEALSNIIQEKYPHLSLIYQKVKYGQKDQYWKIEGHDRDEIKSDSLAVWLSTSYVKSPDYTHEEELRIMIINRKQPGSLPTSEKYLEFNDPRIATSVIDHGEF